MQKSVINGLVINLSPASITLVIKLSRRLEGGEDYMKWEDKFVKKVEGAVS
jgi:hypothetical protein